MSADVSLGAAMSMKQMDIKQQEREFNIFELISIRTQVIINRIVINRNGIWICFDQQIWEFNQQTLDITQTKYEFYRCLTSWNGSLA